MAQIAIIGAGVAGLAAGQELIRHGHRVTVYEKSRGLGGRVATRRVAGFHFDHGAQYVKAPTPDIAALLGDAVDIGRDVWTFDGAGAVAPGDPAQNADPKWIWPGGVNALGKALATGLAVRRETHVARLAQTAGGYRLYSPDDAPLGDADAVLLTPPAPQTAAIIAASDLAPALQQSLVAELARAVYRRCITVTLAYAQRPATPWYALVNVDRRHPVSWLACEHVKPGYAPEGSGLIMLQMADAWSTTHWDALAKGTLAPDALPAAVLEAHGYAEALTGAALGQPLWADLHRWRYALPDAGCNEPTLNGTGSGLYFAGDYVAGQGRVHLAIASGRAVAERMHRDNAAG
jgi:predicted NAD/FAD-dependent oxidoreductase